MKSMAHAYAGRLLVTVHKDQDPHDEEWDRYLRELGSVPELSRMRLLVFSQGGGPNGQQRNKLLKLVGKTPPTVAILTTSAFLRTMGAALQLAVRTMRTFRVTELEDAMQFLELKPDEQREATRLLTKLTADLGIDFTSIAGERT